MTISRRNILRLALASGAVGAAWPLTPGLGPAKAYAAAQRLGARWDSPPFTLGVASGDPLPTSVVLWTKVAPDPLANVQQLADVVQVDWVVATDPGISDIVDSGSVAASALLAHSVHVTTKGLTPGNTYFYQFSALGKKSRIGRTRTAPIGAVSKVRFASLSCQDYTKGEYTGLADIAADTNLDFVVHLGDYIYEYIDGIPPDSATTLAEFRKIHALYKGDPALRAAHAAHPWYLTWDNHEVQGHYIGSDGASPSVARRAGAYQAWFENMPIRIDGQDTALPDPQIYRQRRWGDLLNLVILDLRQYRSPEEITNGTILGATQKKWLLSQVDNAPDSWNCWVNSIMLGQQRLDDKYLYTQQWDGFLAERKAVLSHVEKADLEDLIVITGDWHSAFVQDLKPDFDAKDSPRIGTEFVAHSLTSNSNGNRWNVDEGPKLGAGNPHLQYFEGDRYGYDLYEVTPKKWTTHMRVTSDRSSTSATMSTLSTWHVDRGTVGAYEDPTTETSAAHYRRAT